MRADESETHSEETTQDQRITSKPEVTERTTWFKIKNRTYSRMQGRKELFERERHKEPVAGWHSCELACADAMSASGYQFLYTVGIQKSDLAASSPFSRGCCLLRTRQSAPAHRSGKKLTTILIPITLLIPSGDNAAKLLSSKPTP